MSRIMSALTLGLAHGFSGGDLPWTGRIVRALLPSRWACAIGLHGWRICSLSLAGHQSERSRRCDPCFDRGRLLIETQALSYFGRNTGEPWVVERDERGSIIDGRFEAS